MSQASKILKKIASGEEYQALVAAIERADYETIVSSYLQIGELLNEAAKEIREKIESLPRQNRDEEHEKFQVAFARRSKASLPQWYWLESELERQRVMEGRVFGFGSRGDPLVRTPEGRVVVIRDTTLEEGQKLRFKIVTEGDKLDFGRLFELTPHSLYLILIQDTRERIRDSLTSIKERINNQLPGTDAHSPTETSKLLNELEEVRELAPRLREEEKERADARVIEYRRRLLKALCDRMAFEFISQTEQREIEELCAGDEQEIAEALSAPGLFRHQAHEAIRGKLFSGEKPRGYDDILDKLERSLDSMSTALELMDFKTGIEEAYPQAKRYLDRMDRFFKGLSIRAERIAISTAEDKTCNIEEVESAVRTAFSDEALGSELRKVFRSAEEFFALREKLVQLRTMLGNAESIPAETILKPYLRRKLALAFGGRS